MSEKRKVPAGLVGARRDRGVHRRRGRTVGVCACVILGLFVWLYQEEVVALFSREDAGDELKLPDNTRAAARRHGPEDKPGRAAQGGAGQDPDSSLPQSDETNAGAGKGSADPEPRDQLDSLDPRSLLKAAEEAAEAADQEYQRRPGDGSSAAGSGTGAGVGAGIGAHGGVRVETGNLEDIMRQRLREKLRGQEQGQGQGLGRGRDVRADVIKLLRAQREAAAERLQGLREGADQEAAGAAAAVDKDPVAARPGFAEAWGEREKAKSTDEATCEQLLDSKDEVFYSRDFQAEPIRVHSSQVMRWTCDVPCVFANDDSLTYDGGLGTGKGTYNIIRSMEAASYYGNNDVNKARGAGFDIIMTVHFFSDVPVQYGSWEEYDLMRPLDVKDPTVGTAAAFISNCAATNFRLQALEQLQKSIKVDSYGRCSNTMGVGQVDKQLTLNKYKFSLAFENSVETDYVTEKFWQSLVAGAVPVVIGAPNIHFFAPSNNSYLHIKSMDDVDSVAARIKKLAGDEEAWGLMVRWKQDGPTDDFLANMDISAVHSSCRLCIYIADKLRTQEGTVARRARPCRCLDMRSEGGAAYVYHVFVRERFTFEYTPIVLDAPSLTLTGLAIAIQYTFSANNHRPVWADKRPQTLATQAMVEAHKVYRIYPTGLTQKDVLQGDGWFKTDKDFLDHLAKNPCPNLEVIFV